MESTDCALSDVTFNIVYVGRTVSLLLPFLPTLLAHSECRFRLVANGCTAEEEAQIQALCRNQPRLLFCSVGRGRVLPHGEVLTHLRAQERSPFFAFMDSDIFATGPFLEAHLQTLQQQSALFSCLPLWHDQDEVVMAPGFKVMSGRFMQAPDGTFLGLSYYAIYHASSLNEFISRTGITFQSYHWHDLPPRYQRLLEQLGLRMAFYDTGKVLNLLMQHEGARMAYVLTPHLTHIGAISGIGKQWPFLPWDELVMLLPLRLQNRMRLWRYQRIGRFTRTEMDNLNLLMRKRRAARLYLREVVNGKSSPVKRHYLKSLPPQVQQELESLALQVGQIHAVYRGTAL